jgi:hypothetical protein
MNMTIKEMRTQIVAFVKSMGGHAGRAEIKRHLGLDPMTYSEPFNRAVKTVKLRPVYGTGEISPGLFLSRKPVVAYRTA